MSSALGLFRLKCVLPLTLCFYMVAGETVSHVFLYNQSRQEKFVVFVVFPLETLCKDLFRSSSVAVPHTLLRKLLETFFELFY